MSGLHKSWQVMLADLAMILFLVAASAVPATQHADDAPPTEPPSTIVTAAVQGAPGDIYRDDGNDAGFARWLGDRVSDSRETLTIRGGRAEGGYNAALSRAATLVQIAEANGAATRIVLEPEAGDQIVAVFAFDRRGQPARLADATPAAPGSGPTTGIGM